METESLVLSTRVNLRFSFDSHQTAPSQIPVTNMKPYRIYKFAIGAKKEQGGIQLAAACYQGHAPRMFWWV